MHLRFVVMKTYNLWSLLRSTQQNKLFERELEGKLRDFYDALSWDFASENLECSRILLSMANYNQIFQSEKIVELMNNSVGCL